MTHLDLSDNGLGTEGSIAINTMMKENCYITHLDLSDNDLGPAGAYSIAAVVSFNNTLTHLSLRGTLCSLEEHRWTTISVSLAQTIQFT